MICQVTVHVFLQVLIIKSMGEVWLNRYSRLLLDFSVFLLNSYIMHVYTKFIKADGSNQFASESAGCRTVALCLDQQGHVRRWSDEFRLQYFQPHVHLSKQPHIHLKKIGKQLFARIATICAISGEREVHINIGGGEPAEAGCQ